MEENSQNNPPPDNVSYLKEIRDAVVGIHDLLHKRQSARGGTGEIVNLGMQQHKNSTDVPISKEVVVEQLKISPSTLANWRYRKCIKYHAKGSRLVEYSYIDVMDALAENKLTARGFNPYTAYQRMLEWYKKNVENPGQQ